MQRIVVEMQTKQGEKARHTLGESRLGKFSPEAARYTSSVELDKNLFDAVIAINLAHIVMLARQKLVNQNDSALILSTLSVIPRTVKQKDELEDVHMNVENYVISKVGMDVGGMLNLGKSRNDQVATALRMTLRGKLLVLAKKLTEFETKLLAQALKHSASVMPGYTHLQRAQPITLGHHLMAYCEALERDFSRIIALYSRVNRSPMGSGALASTGFPIDRALVARLLGFDAILGNSLDAVSSRDFATEAIFVCAQIMTDLSRISEEIVLWSTEEFGFVRVSDDFATTSSMMPQKKNPVVAEIARARAAQVQADLVGALSIAKSLPLSYNIDLQELTYNLWSAVEKAVLTLDIFAKMMHEIKFDSDRMLEAVESDDYLFATELADYLVTKFHLSFREAHGKVGALVRFCEENLQVEDSPFRALGEEDLASILGVPLTKKELEALLDPIYVLSKRKQVGSPNPSLVRKACIRAGVVAKNHSKTIGNLERRIIRSESELDNAVGKIKTTRR